MAEQYPQYAGLTDADLKARIAANNKKMDAMEPGINAAKAKLRLAEREKHAAVEKLRAERGYTTRELFDVGKGLSKNPNDPKLLAEKARLKGLRDAYEKKLEPYRAAEEKAHQEVRKASDGYTDLWAENGDMDHKMRLATDPKAEWGDSDELWEQGDGVLNNKGTVSQQDVDNQVSGNTTDTGTPTTTASNNNVQDGTEGTNVDSNVQEQRDASEETFDKVDKVNEVQESQEGKSTGGVQESTEGKGSGNVVNEESAEGSEKLDATTEEEIDQEEALSTDDESLVDDDPVADTEEIGGASNTDGAFEESLVGDDDLELGDQFTEGAEGDDLTAFGGPGDDVKVDFNPDTPPELKRNILNDFVNYTYHLELFILGAEDYNEFVKDPSFEIESKPGALLIKSGGGGANRRNKYFKLDYYMDNLELYSVIAPKGENNLSTNVELSFDITEPYGMTLLNSLVMACKDLGSYNYIDQPYLLKISFKGYDAEGKIAKMDSPAMTRYIPIRFTELNFSASQEGTQYRCRAMVYHSMGLSNTKATVPSDIKIEATTVGEFFLKQLTSITNKEVVKVADDPYSDYAYKTKEDVVEKTQGGLAGFLNNLEKEYVKAGTKNVPDEFAFEIDKTIGESKILLQNLVELRKIKNDKDPRKVALGQFYSNFKFNEEKQSFTIRAGTNLPNVIHSIIRTCEYMINQVTLTNVKQEKKESLKYSEGQNKPINFYRIVPRIEIIPEWDIKRNCYAKRITYVIKKHEMRGKDYENLGQAQITNFVKEYKYIYTGENTEILNFDIQFNAAYYQKNLYGIIEKTKGSATVKGNTADESSIAEGNLATTNPDGTTNVTPIMKEVSIAVPGSTDINTPIVDPKTLIVNNFMQDVMASGADLVELNLEILGDPSYIQNHDIRHATLASQGFPAMDPQTRALNPDREWHVTVEFRNPTDINEVTGLYEGFGVNEEGVAVVTAPTMSGIYKAIEVRSKFNNGVFSQSLQLVRERLQTASLADAKEQDPSKNVAANNSATGKLNKQGGEPDKPTIGKSTAPHLEGKHSGLDMSNQLLGDKKMGTMTAEAQGINTDDLIEEDVDYIGDADADTGGWQPPNKTQAIGSETEEVAKETRSSLTGTTASNATQPVAKEKPLPQNVSVDRVTGGYRAFNPTTGKARGFNNLAEAEAFARG